MPAIENTAVVLALWGLIGYLLGSIPFGLLLTRAFGIGNLRDIGSGNIGATNVLRTGNKKAAALTLLLDGAKGAVAVLLARHFAGEDAAQLAALLAFLGHCFPVWLGFKGGKGVATFLGILLALVWPVGMLCCITWLAAVAATRISSLGALVAAAASAPYTLLLGQREAAVLALLLTLLIFWRHSSNLSRIRAGIEPKVGQKSA
ncbi:glycerol-3-phosphate 1-O-acyltransferase PlsY [Puniceibacterium sediminis]|uniref:Glycerol-3-phosphate acyltransferase n=1 Tax=Puniceibacterium sediminis TaxID=1608407 RepID=A0A238WKI2_9RHOB|nr:glycerol-3-phosphate 1-O-acyltransferase PlsY [Puniceibacterium sediminis]SNR46997.1 acyl-phosphate glycerol-3-phosphate acyltransferase [Puniceibacterium sediminis]